MRTSPPKKPSQVFLGLSFISGVRPQKKPVHAQTTLRAPLQHYLIMRAISTRCRCKQLGRKLQMLLAGRDGALTM